MHPMAPFITEEIFSLLKQKFPSLPDNPNCDPYTQDLIQSLHAKACIIAPYPKTFKQDLDENIENTFSFLEEIIYSVRNIRGQMQIPPSEKTDLYISSQNEEKQNLVKENQHVLFALLKIENLLFSEQKGFGASCVVDNLTLFVPLPEKMKEKEIARLLKEQEKLQKSIHLSQDKLQNSTFKQKAPQEVIEKMQKSLQSSQSKLQEVQTKLTQFS